MRVWPFLVFALYLAALTFPGVQPFNRIEPFVLGLPFVFVWSILWVAIGWVVLIVVHLRTPRQRQ